MEPQEDEETLGSLGPLVMMVPLAMTRSRLAPQCALISNLMGAMEASARVEARVYAAEEVVKDAVRSLKTLMVILLAQRAILTRVVTLAMHLPAIRSLLLRGLVRQVQVQAKLREERQHMIGGTTLAYVTYVVSFLNSHTWDSPAQMARMV